MLCLAVLIDRICHQNNIILLPHFLIESVDTFEAFFLDPFTFQIGHSSSHTLSVLLLVHFESVVDVIAIQRLLVGVELCPVIFGPQIV